MRDRFARVVEDAFRADERLAVVLAEISTELFAGAVRHDPRRAVNVGIMEQTAVGVAAGFALEGFHPVVHTIAPFLTERALEQVKLDLGYQGLGATLVSVGASFDYATEGGTHHAPGDVAAMLTVPGMRVLVPGSAGEVATLLGACLVERDLSYVRLSALEHGLEVGVRPGQAEVVRRGGRGTVVAVGPLLGEVLHATEALDVTVLYVTTVAPLDAALAALAAETAEVVAVQPFFEGTLAAGLAGAFRERPTRLLDIGVPRRFFHEYGEPADLLRAAGLDAPALRERIAAFLGPTPRRPSARRRAAGRAASARTAP